MCWFALHTGLFHLIAVAEWCWLLNKHKLCIFFIDMLKHPFTHWCIFILPGVVCIFLFIYSAVFCCTAVCLKNSTSIYVCKCIKLTKHQKLQRQKEAELKVRAAQLSASESLPKSCRKNNDFQNKSSFFSQCIYWFSLQASSATCRNLRFSQTSQRQFSWQPPPDNKSLKIF